MKLPRTVSGESLAKSLQKLDYRATRQVGSHIRLTCDTLTSITSPFPIMTRSAWVPCQPFWLMLLHT